MYEIEFVSELKCINTKATLQAANVVIKHIRPNVSEDIGLNEVASKAAIIKRLFSDKYLCNDTYCGIKNGYYIVSKQKGN